MGIDGTSPAAEGRSAAEGSWSAPPAGELPPHLGRDLLRFRLVSAVVRSRWYPGVLRLPVAGAFGLVVYELLRGPNTAGANAGSALMWLLWWPALPIVFLITGRFWCSVCPFGTVSDIVHRLVGVEGRVPRILRSYGVWIIDIEFLTITWADHVWGIVDSPWGSGLVLLLLTTAVVASGAFLPRRSFCRYLCFLGGLCGNYARAGTIQLRAEPDVCATCTGRAVCYHGTASVEGCPLFSFPRTLDTAAHCNLCARCLRSCPHNAIAIRPRLLFSELWSIQRPQLEEATLAMAIMGVVLIQNLSDVTGWRSWLNRTGVAVGYSEAVVFTCVFVATVFLPVGLLTLASAVAGRNNGASIRTNFTRFGYALIPLDIAAFVAHTQRDVLGEGRRLYVTLARLVGAHPAAGSPALATPNTIRFVQWTIILFGVAAALRATHQIARAYYTATVPRQATLVPYRTLVVFLGVLNIVMFAFPARS
jgi:polyferredoxin